MPFIKLYRVISILGVGAFGVVLEVENMVTKEISALKVIPFLYLLISALIGHQQKGLTTLQTAQLRARNIEGVISPEHYLV